jgi:hypothetical protein
MDQSVVIIKTKACFVKVVPALLVILSLLSCTPRYQVWETQTSNLKEIDNHWAFENSEVVITYYFWEKNGVMAFSIYNKTDKPIYVDWKKSSLIHNGNKFDYWTDEELSTMISHYHGYYYLGPVIPWFSVSAGTRTTTSKTIKPERVTFIPPKSNYHKSQFHLMPDNSYTSSNKAIKSPSEIRFDYKESPLKFRNYLAFSLSESSQEHLYTDNEFYIAKITIMKRREFRGSKGSWLDENVTYTYPYKDPKKFFIEVMPYNAADYDR